LSLNFGKLGVSKKVFWVLENVVLGFDFSENGRRMGWGVIWDRVGRRLDGSFMTTKWKLNDNKMEVLDANLSA